MVGYSAVDLKLLNKKCNCIHSNIKLLRDGLIAFIFNVLVYNFLSNLLRQLSLSLPVVHVQCGRHHDTKQHTDYFSPFKYVQPVGRPTGYTFEDTCDANESTHLSLTCPHGQIIFNLFLGTIIFAQACFISFFFVLIILLNHNSKAMSDCHWLIFSKFLFIITFVSFTLFQLPTILSTCVNHRN